MYFPPFIHRPFLHLCIKCRTSKAQASSSNSGRVVGGCVVGVGWAGWGQREGECLCEGMVSSSALLKWVKMLACVHVRACVCGIG